MTPRLSKKDLFLVLDFVEDLYGFFENETFIRALVCATHSLMGAELCDSSRYDVQGHRISYNYFPHNFPIPPHQIPFLLVMRLPMMDDRSKAVLRLHRSSKDFTHRDRLLFETIRPHVIQASTQAFQVTQLQHSVTTLSEGFSQSGQAAVQVNAQGQMLGTTGSAEVLLENYGEDTRDMHHDRLPNPFRDWMRQQNALLDHTEPAPATHRPLILHQGPRTLTVCFIRNGRHQMLLLKEDTLELNWEALNRFGLTTREGEVLTWALQGKSNPEMSQILGAKPGTIQKHLGSIYQKFGVEHRTALVVYVLRLLQTPV